MNIDPWMKGLIMVEPMLIGAIIMVLLVQPWRK